MGCAALLTARIGMTQSPSHPGALR